ncbi:DUF4097 family beta strand repeat-containing protein [Oceanobacillus timonensis]|uniref:DUF4097 family beta strand repeat-containing protein n=1 Tax=Oceanobacillus timonensis TaxID=1926285 RepID=UPI0009BBE27E|nr:DUF4097 family beta strand repeat-containing protein [Oceanobacillus timonensis]
MKRTFDLSKVDYLSIFFERGKGTVEHIPGNNVEIEYYFTKEEHAKSFVFTEDVKEGRCILQLTRANSLKPFQFFNSVYFHIRLPEAYAGKVEIKTITGSITAQDLAVPAISFKTETGSIAIQSLAGQDISVKTTTGHISLDNLESEGENSRSHISSTTGKVFVNHNRLFHVGNIKMTTGNIKLAINSNLTDYCIRYKTRKKISGDNTEIAGNPKNEIIVKTTSGNITRA